MYFAFVTGVLGLSLCCILTSTHRFSFLVCLTPPFPFVVVVSDRARTTLILGYESDPLDESDAIEELLSASVQVIRMKRPMIPIDVVRRTLPGGHATPLLAPPLDTAERIEALLGADSARDWLSYSGAAQTVDELIRWLEQSNL